MPKPHAKLALALQALKDLQDEGLRAIPGSKLSRTDRETLLRAGFLREVVRGWYVARRPDEAEGDTTAWYASMREFVADYARERFGARWHVNPEQSVQLRSGERTLPQQLQIWAAEGSNQTVQLPHGCSLFIYKAARLLPASPAPDCGGLRLVELPAALVAASPSLFAQNAMAARVALGSLPDASDLLRILLEGPHPSAAGRLAGGLRAAGRAAIADEIAGAMRGAGYAVNEADPFETPLPAPLPGGRPESPLAQRLRLMWAQMRPSAIAALPRAPGVSQDVDALLEDVEARYLTDAYHSLSIEGHRVTAALIEKIRDGKWNPDGADRAARDAMAARGYFETHELVKKDLVRVVKGANAGTVFRNALPRWYQALFGPSVRAGILETSSLAGYRDGEVFIRGARHVPPSKEAVRESMPVLFELLQAETDARVRAVLGHFFFVYVHPYMDGNGRLGRFLMNLMLVPAGYVWTVIPVERREEYMHALERASSFGDAGPLAGLIAGLAKGQARRPLRRPG